MTDLEDRIEQLKMEIKAMQEWSRTTGLTRALVDGTYGDKVRELMRLRRQQVRKGRKKSE